MDFKFRMGQQLTLRKSGAPAMVVARQDSLVATFYTLFFHEDGGKPMLVTLPEPDVEAAFALPPSPVSPDIEAMFARRKIAMTPNGAWPRHSAEEAELIEDVAAETGKGVVSVARDFGAYRRKNLAEAEQ